jgi:aryl-alcohol dehydrogenase-like predicted oxidoreductase
VAAVLPRRELGRTGLVVSSLGLGLAALGRPGYINLGHDRDFPQGRSVEAMRRATFEVLDAARRAGIRYVDVARSYGRAEEFLAEWLRTRNLRPDQVTVGTKWGYTYVAGWRTDAPMHEVKDHSLATLRRQVAESTALLGAHLDLLQVHSATRESGVLAATDVLDELVQLRRSGMVRAIGLTLSGPGQADTLRTALEAKRDGERVFDAVQATYNLLEPSAAAVLEEAHAQGMGVLVKEALANGRLVRGDAAARLRPLARGLGAMVDAVALAYVMRQPWIDVSLLGSATPGQLESNVRAADVELSGPALEAIDAMREPAAAYWARRSALPWV